MMDEPASPAAESPVEHAAPAVSAEVPAPAASDQDSVKHCIVQGCKRKLFGKSDPHLVCWACRPSCQSEGSCHECRDWPEEQRVAALRYRCKMQAQRARQTVYRARKRATSLVTPATARFIESSPLR